MVSSGIAVFFIINVNELNDEMVPGIFKFADNT